MPADGYIQIEFDRYLSPATTKRQGYTIREKGGGALDVKTLATVYDPIARTITISGSNPNEPRWLKETLVYELILSVPTDPESDEFGFRAIDRAPLAEPVVKTFRAGPPLRELGAGLPPIAGEPELDFCADVFPIFYFKCANGCHSASESAISSLVLQTVRGIETTALGRVAQGANRGRSVGSTTTAPKRFGTDMPLIDKQNNPGESWLLYKVELAPFPDRPVPMPTLDCVRPPRLTPVKRRQTQAVTTYGRPSNDAQRAELASYILGRSMPYPSRTEPTGCTDEQRDVRAYIENPLTFDERERLRLWIARGARTEDCGVCTLVVSDCPDGAPPAPNGGSDGGVPEGGTDAGSDAGDGG